MWCVSSACRSMTPIGTNGATCWSVCTTLPLRSTSPSSAHIDLPDAYLSVTEAIKAGGFANWAKVNVKWVAADRCETTEGAAAALDNVDGIVIPGGFGIRGIDGKIGAWKFARETKLSAHALGLCRACSPWSSNTPRHVLCWRRREPSEFGSSLAPTR